MPNVKLTESFVSKIECTTEQLYWDTEITGLALRVWSSGRKVYIVQHRQKSTQKLHKITLGNSSILELKQARELASKHIYECNNDLINNGIKSITIRDLGKLYVSEREGKKKSLDQDRYIINKYILPTLGGKIVKSITTQDIIDLHSSLHPHRVTANRVRGILNILFKLAVDLSYCKGNPVMKVKKYPENKKEVYLSIEEITALWSELISYERDHPKSVYVINAIRLLLLTGARLREIINLNWNEVDILNKVITLNDRKTAKKHIYLSDTAIDVLQNIPRKNNYVIPGRLGGNQYIYRVWFSIRDNCRFSEHITLHTLRHSYASLAISHGLSLPIVGELLGHSSLRSTQRYAHLYTDVVKEASQRVGGVFNECLVREGK